MKCTGASNLLLIIGVWLVALSIPAAIYLTQQSQDIRQRAQVYPSPTTDCMENPGYECVPDNYVCVGGTINAACNPGEKCGRTCYLPQPSPSPSPSIPPGSSCEEIGYECVPNGWYCTNPVPQGVCPTGQKCGSGCQCTGECECSSFPLSFNYTSPIYAQANSNNNVLQATDCGTCKAILDANGNPVVDTHGVPQCTIESCTPPCRFWCEPCGNVFSCTTTASPTPAPSTTPPPPGDNPQCNDVCYTSSYCRSSEVCYFAEGSSSGNCRNPNCLSESSCTCTNPSPSPSAQCTNVRLYQVIGDVTVATNWQLLTATQLTALRPGDIIYATTLGTTTGGTFDRARIRVNSSTWTTANETTNKKPGSDEFYIIYTIPSDGTVTFTFEAEIHEVGADKWY